MLRHIPITLKHMVALGTIMAVGLTLFLRKPDSLQNPQFFAEDGTVFFIDARQLGLHAVLTQYGGYLHLVPRIVASAAGVFDPLWTPAVYNSAALCLDVAVIAMLFSPRVRLPAKPALALAYALVPHTDEVFLSLTNIQWCLALALVLLLLMDDAATTTQRWFDRGVMALCGLTGPFICFLFPLFAVRAAVRRTFEGAALAVLALLVAAVQVSYLHDNPSLFIRSGPADSYGLLSAMSRRLFGTFWMGYGTTAIAPGPFCISLGAAVTALAGWVALRRGEWRSSRATLALAWLCFVIPVAIKFRYEPFYIGGLCDGDRYFVLPHVLLAWLLVIACVQYKGWRRVIPAALLAASLVINLPYLKVAPLHDYAWAKHVQPIRDGDRFEIPINPPGLVLKGWPMHSPP
jgi:hypothetical protein